jgi:DNA primase
MDAVEEIKSRLSIEDVVAEYVQLKRAGRNFKGLSPFTSEKTPSFTVSPEKQIWHDFSSNRGGDMFTFVQEMEGVDFKGALDLLARRAGVDLEQFQRRGPGDSKEKDRLYEQLELAAKFYQVQFSKSKLALEYVLKQRQFSKDTALVWRLGYAPNTGDALVKFMKSKGFHEREIKQAGLTNRFGGDLFRGRLMIPLQDPSGRVIGFTARQLEDEPNAPKYLNTPQTPLYDKSRHVYGLHLAKQAIRKNKYSVLAEGNLDVIASHQAGIAQCVATAGTALTEYQLKALNRLSGDVRLAFDADRAGIAAAERAIPIASKVGVNLSILTIPSGKDPDELIKQDVSLWQEAIEKHLYALDWLIDRYKRELDLTSSMGKRQFSDTIFAVIRGLADKVEQEHYVQVVAEIIGVNAEALRTRLDEKNAPSKTLRKSQASAAKLDSESIELIRAENRLLALVLLQPKLRDLLVSLEPEFLLEDAAKQLLKFLQENPDFDGNPLQAAKLRGLADYVKITTLVYEELYQGLELLELRYEAERLQAHLVEHYVKSQKHEISQKLQTAANQAEEMKLLTQDKHLNELLHKFKRGK